MIPEALQQKLRDFAPKWHPTRFKATLIGLVVAAVAVPLLLLAMPYLEWFNDMAVQPKGKAQGYYGWFTDQQIVVERPPVEGTVPMTGTGTAAYRMPGENAEQAAERAGRDLKNPIESAPVVLDRGEQLFNTICIVCHGERAEGNGPITGPDLFPAPPSLLTEQARAYPDGRIFHVITKGQNKMPSYADVLVPEDRWAVVHYVRRVLQELARELAEEER